jgi:non-homologous end joining protein Ku
MPRSIWKGAISFGIVPIPVKLHPATQSKSISPSSPES